MHVLQTSMKSPRKSRLLRQNLDFSTPKQTNIDSKLRKIPIMKTQKLDSVMQSNVDSTLRKIAILKTKKKYDEATKLSAKLKSEFGSVAQVVANSSEDHMTVYRLLSSPYSRKKAQHSYVRKLSDIAKRDVIAAYNDEEVSYDLPDRKYAGLKFMSCTTDEAYEIYVRKCQSDRKVAPSTFKSLRPDYVRTIQQTPLRGCKCEQCTDLGFLRETLIGKGFKGIPKNHSASIEATWCEFRTSTYKPGKNSVALDELPKMECVRRQCSRCGVAKYREKLEALNSALLEENSTVSWKQWEYVEASTNRKSNKTTRKMGLVYYTGTVRELLDKYLESLDEMSFHQFSKLWQLKQFKLCQSNLRHGQVLMVLDFSQNILLYSNPEPQACHWDHQQVTVHPIVVYYRCPDPGCDELVVEELIHITGDRHHDLQAVSFFEESTIQYLLSKGIPLNVLIEFTDNCSQQFKSKNFFFELSVTEFRKIRHYFGSRHAKSASDRAAANFKVFVKKAVLAGKADLRTIDQLVQYATEHYEKNEKHRKIKIMYHPRIERTAETDKFKPFNGTQKIHSVRNLGVSSVVEKRDVSCCCNKCQNDEGECTFPDYADEWHRFSMVVGGPRKRELHKFPNHWEQNQQADTNEEAVTEPSQSPVSDEAVMNDETIAESNQGSDDDESVTNNETVTNDEIVVELNHQASDSDEPDTDGEAILEPTSTSNATIRNTNRKFWLDLSNELESARDYESLRSIVLRKISTLPPLELKMKRTMSRSDVIDAVGQKFFPRDGPKSLVPIENEGDGNCLPRALGHLFLSDQDDHVEVRVRIVFEGVANSDLYVSDAYLSRGLPESSCKGVASSYCLYSGFANRRYLSEVDIMNIYKKEMLTVRRKGTEMGMWEFHMATQVFSRPIGTVYPEHTNPYVRKHTNRIILPLRECFDILEPVFVMWTPLHLRDKPFQVKHFVPLMKYEHIS